MQTSLCKEIRDLADNDYSGLGFFLCGCVCVGVGMCVGVCRHAGKTICQNQVESILTARSPDKLHNFYNK